MQNKPLTRKSGRTGRIPGLVFTDDPAMSRSIAEEVRPLCHIERTTDSPEEILQTVEQEGIQILFIHLTAGTDEKGMALTRQLRRTHPASNIFIVTDRKDPDLILEGLRLGVRDVLPPSSNGDRRFLPSLQKALSRGEAEDRNGFIYSLFSLKGGQGVSSLAVNLADQMHTLTQGTVLLADLNLYMGDVASQISRPADFTPYELIRDLSRMDENLLFSSLDRHPNGFYVLPSPSEISDAERIPRDQVTNMLALLKRYFSYIIMDLPHDFSERTLAAIEASDRVMVIVEQDLVSVKSTQQVLRFFRDLNYDEERTAVLLNRMNKSSLLQPEDIQMVLKQPLFSTVSNDWQSLSKAAQKGDLLSTGHGKKKVTRDIRRLVGMLTGMDKAKERGFFQRLFGG